MVFSYSWFFVFKLKKRNSEIGQVDGFADIVLRMYAYFESDLGKGDVRVVVVEGKAMEKEMR
jgi:hypothetical protein